MGLRQPERWHPKLFHSIRGIGLTIIIIIAIIIILIITIIIIFFGSRSFSCRSMAQRPDFRGVFHSVSFLWQLGGTMIAFSP